MIIDASAKVQQQQAQQPPNSLNQQTPYTLPKGWLKWNIRMCRRREPKAPTQPPLFLHICLTRSYLICLSRQNARLFSLGAESLQLFADF